MSPISAKGYIKIARLVAEMPYPPISAWEFKTLGRETAVQEKLRPATVYIIAQRPLLWFDREVSDDHSISFEITDANIAILAVLGWILPSHQIEILFRSSGLSNDCSPLLGLAECGWTGVVYRIHYITFKNTLRGGMVYECD